MHSQNPLFPGSSQPRPDEPDKPDQPADNSSSNAAVDLIRQKLDRLYTDAPDTEQEIAEAEAAGPARSRHQQFMHELSTSGKSLTQVQTEWHHYYANLPDAEKRVVWQEFYAATNQQPPNQPASFRPATPEPSSDDETPNQPSQTQHQAAHTAAPTGPHRVIQPARSDSRLPADIKQQLLQTIGKRAKAKLKPKHHIQSLLFGLGCGGLALLVVLFSFFNEMVIAPFIQPSRTVNATPIIIGTDGVAPTDKSEVIIPKINVQIPLDFSAKTIKEDDIQKALESGVVHYPTTPLPGQQGNTAFFGHSSNNIFNPGKYKFAFVLLHELVTGDTFYLTRDGVAYAYQVIDKKVVSPTEVSILDAVPGKIATATLITCDPPGTTLKRLVVIGEQVSPMPTSNMPGGIQTALESGSQSLPGNAPSLWHRLTQWLR